MRNVKKGLSKVKNNFDQLLSFDVVHVSMPYVFLKDNSIIVYEPAAENDEKDFLSLFNEIDFRSKSKQSFVVVFCWWLASNEDCFLMLLSSKKKYGVDTRTTPKESSWSTTCRARAFHGDPRMTTT